MYKQLHVHACFPFWVYYLLWSTRATCLQLKCNSVNSKIEYRLNQFNEALAVLRLSLLSMNSLKFNPDCNCHFLLQLLLPGDHITIINLFKQKQLTSTIYFVLIVLACHFKFNPAWTAAGYVSTSARPVFLVWNVKFAITRDYFILEYIQYWSLLNWQTFRLRCGCVAVLVNWLLT